MIENQLKDLDVWFGNGIPDDQGVLSCCKSVCFFFFWIGVITALSICPSRRIFIYHLWLVFFHSWGWLVKQVWVWRKPWRRKPSRTTRRLMTDFEPSSVGRCQDSQDRVPWAVETEVCKKMFSLKVSSSCDVATEATFHSFGLIAFASLWSFSRWWHHVSVSLLMPAQWKFPDLAKCQKDMAAVAVAPMTSSKRNCCRNSNYILKIKGVRENLCIFPTLPERFGIYY